MKQDSQYNLQSERSTLATISDLWQYMWPKNRWDLKFRVIFAIFYMILGKLALLAVPYLYKYLVDSLVPFSNLSFKANLSYFIFSVPLILVFAYNFARLLQSGINQLRDILFAKVGQHAVRNLAIVSFKHIHKLSLRFHLERRTGALSRIIERGIKSIETIVRFVMLHSVPALLEFIFVAAALCYSCGIIYFFIIAIMVIIYVWFSVVISNRRIAIRRAMNNADNLANSRSVDALLNYETVKYFGNEAAEAERFDAAMQQYEKAAIRIWVSLGFLNFGQAVILGLGMFAIMAISVYDIMQHKQTVGDFVFINSLLIQLSIPLNFIGSLYREIRQAITDVESVFNLLSTKAEITDKKPASVLAIKEASIEFKDVSFSYESDRQILHNVSFKVDGGKRVAIVGATGSGKSTILRLLFRFYEVSSGAIEIDGQNIADLTQHSLRHAIGVVPQDTVLFNDSIKYNIAYGRLNATEEEIFSAARQAQIHDFILSLPQGYDTLVGERGLKLSGGEKQRIAIARTILKAPAILLLDEATSALDTTTERNIQSALDLVSQGRTTIVIAHRLSTITNADEIIVLSKGNIIEQGTHEALLQKNGEYALMWQKQKEVTKAQETLAREDIY